MNDNGVKAKLRRVGGGLVGVAVIHDFAAVNDFGGGQRLHALPHRINDAAQLILRILGVTAVQQQHVCRYDLHSCFLPVSS